MAAPDEVFVGIGNEVLVTGIVLFTSIIIWAVFSIRSINQSLVIHPANVDAVNSARNILFSDRLFNSSVSSSTETTNDTSDPGESSTASNSNNHQGNLINQPTVQHYGMDSQCPICLNEPRLPIETNCGHLFCANCIIVYWRHGNWSTSGPIRCPVCRQQVTLLLCCFRPIDNSNSSSASTSANTTQTERTRAIHDINDYNRRYSGEPRPWLDYLRDLPTLLRHMSNEFFTLGGLMYMLRIRIVLCFVAAIMYLISPLDMIPEAVFGILGLLDDVFVVLVLAVYVTIIYRQFLANRWENESF